MIIEMAFVEDARTFFEKELRSWGYTLPESTGNADQDAHAILVAFWNARARRIEVRPRNIHWSAELRTREPSLPSPIRSGLGIAENEVATGIDLTARLSRQLPKLDFNDQMLNDWGVTHLHLDATDRSKGTKEILFVLIRPDDAYFIDVLAHGHGYHPWVEEDLIEIVHVNWPETIARFRQDARLAVKLTREQRRNLRSKNANASVQTSDGTVYTGIGGGMVASGSNIQAIMWSDHIRATAQAVEAWIRANGDTIVDTIERERGVRPDQVKLGLTELSSDRATVNVDSVEPPFSFFVPIYEPPKLTIDLRADVPTPLDSK